MKRFLMAACVAALSTAVQAQTNGLDPSNLPPEDFDGREFTDRAGCAFLRSTFGGEVIWLPRYGVDRAPVCGLSPTEFENTIADTDLPDTDMPETATDEQDVRVEVGSDTGMDEQDVSVDVVRDPALDTELNTAPDTTPESVPGETTSTRQVADTPATTAASGARVQVGTFSVPENAVRLVARLNAQGMAASSFRSRGLTVVVVGPFGDVTAAGQALSQVRAMGFTDAFLSR